MKKTIQYILLILLVANCAEALAQSALESIRTKTATVKKAKEQLNAMLLDSKTEFLHNHYKANPEGKFLFEDKENNILYYEPYTKYNGEVSLIRVEKKDDKKYKSLIYGWLFGNTTSREIKEEAATVRKAARELIRDKVKTEGYKSYTVKSTDSSSRTELRDKEGRRILEIADHKTYFHLIVFGETWRVNPVDGLLSDFTIFQVILLRKEYSLK